MTGRRDIIVFWLIKMLIYKIVPSNTVIPFVYLKKYKSGVK